MLTVQATKLSIQLVFTVRLPYPIIKLPRLELVEKSAKTTFRLYPYGYEFFVSKSRLVGRLYDRQAKLIEREK